MLYRIQPHRHVGPWGEDDGTTYSIVNEKGERIAVCDRADHAELVLEGLILAERKNE